MCICTQRQQLIGGVGWYEWCSCTTPLGGLSLSLSHNLNANTTIDFGHSPIQCNVFSFYKSLHLLWLRFQTLWQTLMLINVNYKFQIYFVFFLKEFSVEIFQFLVITLAPSWKDALALILSNLTFLTFDGKFILGFKKRGSDQYCGKKGSIQNSNTLKIDNCPFLLMVVRFHSDEMRIATGYQLRIVFVKQIQCTFRSQTAANCKLCS